MASANERLEDRLNNGSAPGPNPSSHPWELRDQRFRDSQSMVAQRENTGQRSGSASSLPLNTYTDRDQTLAANGKGALNVDKGGKADDPTLARRGLAPEIKAEIVEMFAQFQSVSHVSDMLKRDHGLTLDRRTIESFNPDSTRCRIGKRLKSLFNSQRKAYIEESAKVAVAHQAHRLRLIGQIVEKATTAKDFSNALKGLELAAKEMGGLSQEVKHTGIVSHVHGTVEEARRELADRLKAMVPAIDLQPCNATGEDCNATEEPDNGAPALQVMPSTPSDERDVHISSQRIDQEDRA